MVVSSPVVKVGPTSDTQIMYILRSQGREEGQRFARQFEKVQEVF